MVPLAASRRRLAVRLVAAGVLLVVGYTAVTAAQVAAASRRDERDAADVIVVLGAAQYDGRPSPVFAARLDHALALWQGRVAPIIAVTGGNQPGDRPRVTEALAAANYLLQRGVPDEAILREVDARTTWDSLAAVARILRQRDLRDVVLVTDPPHSLRVALIADDFGLHAQVSPTRTSPAGLTARLRQGARETVAVAVGRVIGHRRLRNLSELLGAG